ncbi:ankyrin repeat-containing domain protein [Russula ochroleuca]|uniref:Ankyrin repeat-containing domain protein n=1 Tax=Russula ochroleuca TaxID=152965 RepID=A0A9P5MLQ4_9AGAM|nr:ankyrin repeat-containing domain protein [Russula ochroleuca]
MSKSSATPLYYAALCGFQDLVEHLTVNDPKQVKAIGGHYVTPLVAALAKGHFQTAKFLSDNGAPPNVRGFEKMTPLLSAAYNGDFKMSQVLLKYKADIHARNDDGKTALHLASHRNSGQQPNIGPSLSNVARLLLEHGADINARMDGILEHYTLLHLVAEVGRVEVVPMLLQHGANVGVKDGSGRTALQIASAFGRNEIMKLLSEHGAM